MKPFKIFLVAVLMLLAFNTSAQPPDCVPGFYKSDNPTFVQFFEYADTDFMQGDYLFIYYWAENGLTIVGGNVFIAGSGNVVKAFMHETHPAAPELQSGLLYGQDLYIGLSRNCELYSVDLANVYKYKTDIEVEQLKAYPLAAYNVKFARTGPPLAGLIKTPYLKWLHSQCPELKDDMVVDIGQPRYQDKFKYTAYLPGMYADLNIEVLQGDGQLRPKEQTYFFGKEDLQTGEVKLLFNITPYPECESPVLSDVLTIKFDPLPNQETPGKEYHTYDLTYWKVYTKKCMQVEFDSDGNLLIDFIAYKNLYLPTCQLTAKYRDLKGKKWVWFINETVLDGELSLKIKIPPVAYDFGKIYFYVTAPQGYVSNISKPIN